MGATLSNNNSALKKSNVKLQAQNVSAFSGEAIKWRPWKKRTRVAIGTAGMLDILDDSGLAKKSPIDNETVFHLLQVATADGSAAHLVDAHEATKDGNAAYNELVTWYEGDELTTETAEDVRAKLDKLNLNTKTSAPEYINMFQLLTKQLDELGEAYTQSKTVHIFLSQITDPDFDNTKELCVENKYEIAECIERIRAKERRLSRNRDAPRYKNLSIRRTGISGNDTPNDISTYINSKGFYSIPRNVWHSLDANSQELVKKHNGDLRRSRRNTTQPEPQVTEEKTAVIRRLPTGGDIGDDNPSPSKRMRTVQFVDDSDHTKSNETEVITKPNVINQRRDEIIKFQVKNSSSE